MRNAVFLDRDGVINRKPAEHDYVKSWEEFELLPGVVGALKLLRGGGWVIVVITNQRGVSRGLVSKRTVEMIHMRLQKLLEESGVKIDGVYWCGHGEEDGCNCRKPKPGLIFRAEKELDIDLKRSYFIGDSEADRLCGARAGVRTIIIKSNSSLLPVVEKAILA